MQQALSIPLEPRTLPTLRLSGAGEHVPPPTWVMDQLTQVPELRILAFWERGWHEHHDVVVLMKRPLGAPSRPLLL